MLATIGLSNIAPSVDTLHNLHVHLTSAIKLTSHGRARVFSHLLIYPTGPQELPVDRLVHACGTVRPVGCPLDVKSHIARLMKIPFQRSSAAGVSTPPCGSPAGHAMSSPPVANSPQLEHVLATMNTTMQAFAHVLHSSGNAIGGGVEHGGANSRALGGFVPRARPLQLPWAPAPSAAADASGGALGLPAEEALGLPAEEALGPRAQCNAPPAPVAEQDPENAVDVMRAAMHAAAMGRGRGAGAKRVRGAKKQDLLAAASSCRV